MQHDVVELGAIEQPVAADGRLYFTGEDGKVQVVQAGPAVRVDHPVRAPEEAACSAAGVRAA